MKFDYANIIIIRYYIDVESESRRKNRRGRQRRRSTTLGNVIVSRDRAAAPGLLVTVLADDVDGFRSLSLPLNSCLFTSGRAQRCAEIYHRHTLGESTTSSVHPPRALRLCVRGALKLRRAPVENRYSLSCSIGVQASRVSTLSGCGTREAHISSLARFLCISHYRRPLYSGAIAFSYLPLPPVQRESRPGNLINFQ